MSDAQALLLCAALFPLAITALLLLLGGVITGIIVTVKAAINMAQSLLGLKPWGCPAEPG